MQSRLSKCFILTAVLAVALPAMAGDQLWVTASPTGEAVVQKMDSPGAPGVAVQKSNRAGFVLDVHVPGVRLEPVKGAEGEFVRLDWADAAIAGEIGQPALPVIRRLFAAPTDGDVQLKVTATSQAVTLAEKDADIVLRAYPRQAPVPKIEGALANAPFNFDAEAYAETGAALSDIATITEAGFSRGQRLMILEIRPVSNDPVARTLTLTPDVQVEVSFSGATKSAPQMSALPGLDQVVVNPEMLAPATRAGGNYLIVTAPAFASQIAAFANAKTAQGFNVTTYTAAAANSTTIKSYISSLWGTANAPDYILLVGDTDTIPSITGGGEGTPATDIAYACMDAGDDWYPDIAIGRFPARTAAQLTAMVNKTLYYENGPLADPDYLKRAVFMASTDNYTISEGTHNWVIQNHMVPNEYVCDKLYTVTYNATTQDTRDSFNAGRFFGIYSGHGGTYSWADGPVFEQSDVNNLTNQNMYAFVCSFACITGTYTVDECFTETWIRAANKGAAAIYGSSVNSYWTEDDVLEKRLFDAIFDADDDVPAEVGPVWMEARIRYLAEMGVSATTRRYFEMYNLMGDPSLRFPGACSDTGSAALNKAKYACGDTAQITVGACGLNLDDAIIDTVDVTVVSDSDPTGLVLTLSETDIASAAFEGSIELAAQAGTDILQIAEGDTVTLTYIDADDGQGGVNVTVTDTAVIDCTAPVIGNPSEVEVGPRTAQLTFEADEPVQGGIHYGAACGSLTNSAASGSYAMNPVVDIAGLTDDATYFYAIEGTDEAGNTAYDDNAGACYSFTTPGIPDYFTQLFTNTSDLQNQMLTFTPNGTFEFYTGCVEAIESLPTDPSGGMVLALTDDDSEPVTLGASLSIYGNSYTSVYLASNGYITFGVADTDYSETIDEHFAKARVAAVWDDLDPAQGGETSYKVLSDRVAFTWDGVPEHNQSNSNTFQIEVFFDGVIRISFLEIQATDGVLTGLSEGNGTPDPFFASDLSALGACGPRPPLAVSQAVQTPVGQSLQIVLEGLDDGLPDPPAELAYIITSLPARPLMDAATDQYITAAELPYTMADIPTVIYEPGRFFQGTDSFTFVVDDGGLPPEGGQSEIATVDITVGGPATIYTFDMSTDPGWTAEGEWAWGQPTGQSGTGGGPDPTTGATGDNVYGYNLNGGYGASMVETNLTTTKLICTGLSDVTLRFQRWLGVERNTYDHAYIKVSTDGQTWTPVWANGSTSFTDTEWTQVEYDISAYADDQPAVFIRWTMGVTDNSVQYCGWNIDDVEIRAMLPMPGDWDQNGSVEAADFVGLAECMTGPGAAGMGDGCMPLDCDHDGDIDLYDAAAMEMMMTP